MPNNIHRHLARGAGHTTAADVRNNTMSILDKGLHQIVTKYAKNTTPQGRQDLINRLGQLTDGMRQAANNSHSNHSGVKAMAVLSMVVISAVIGKSVGTIGEAIVNGTGDDSQAIKKIASVFGKTLEGGTDIMAFAHLGLANIQIGNGIEHLITQKLRNAFTNGANGVSELRQAVQQVQNQLTAQERNEINQFIDNQASSNDTASASGSLTHRNNRARTRVNRS